jgi:hypothetical protein
MNAAISPKGVIIEMDEFMNNIMRWSDLPDDVKHHVRIVYEQCWDLRSEVHCNDGRVVYQVFIMLPHIWLECLAIDILSTTKPNISEHHKLAAKHWLAKKLFEGLGAGYGLKGVQKIPFKFNPERYLEICVPSPELIEAYDEEHKYKTSLQ